MHLYNRDLKLIQRVATLRLAEHTLVIVAEEPPACDSKDRSTHFQHVASRLRALLEIAITDAWILLLICACMLFC